MLVLFQLFTFSSEIILGLLSRNLASLNMSEVKAAAASGLMKLEQATHYILWIFSIAKFRNKGARRHGGNTLIHYWLKLDAVFRQILQKGSM